MTTTEAASSHKPPGFFHLLIGILIRPRATLTAVKENGRRTWLIMAGIAVVLVMLPPIVSGPITARQSAEAFQQAQAQFGNQASSGITTSGGAEGSGTVAAQAPAFISSPIFTTVIPAIGKVIGLIIGWLLWSGALHLLGSMAGGRNTFGQMMQTVVWAWVPFGIRSIVQTVYIAATGQLIAHPGLSGFVASPQPAEGVLFTPPSTGQLVLQSLLGRIDIYMFWNLGLLLIGIMVMGQLPRRKALGILLIIWAIFTLLSLAPSLVGGIAAGAMG
ncbi:MAG: YIP1 family protein [Anaerolineae bacterium]